MAQSVTGALMGDPGFGPSPAASQGVRPAPAVALRLKDSAPTLDGASPSVPVQRPDLQAHGSEETSLHPSEQSGVLKSGETQLRPVQALKLTVKRGEAATQPPVFMDVAPTDLLIDGSYQRDLADRGVRLITRIIEAWDWRRFKPPVCAWTDAGLVVIDGQHTAIAAATHGGFSTIPVMVVEAKGAEAQASAFVGHNRDRLSLHPTQIHAAAVKAGEPDAVRIEAICARAGVSVVRNPYGSRRYAVGETISVGTIGNLIREHG
ncbi:MAG: hypothetical protein ACYDD1_20020, partial [Caulobacteraceae bacterium]